MIPHSRPTLGEEEAAAAAATVLERRVADGREVTRFEEDLTGRFAVGHAVATGSGTAALQLALLGLRLSAGDEVLIPSHACVAVLNAVRLVGATPVVVDSAPSGFDPDEDGIRAALTGRARAVIVVESYGWPSGPLDLSIPVIRDITHTIGLERPVAANETLVASFHATKMITTARGGALLTGDARLAEIARDRADYYAKRGPTVRFALGMSDVHAAIGRVQLRRLPEFVRRRREIARTYRSAFAGTELALPPDTPSTYYRFPVLTRGDADSFRDAASARGVVCGAGVLEPIHRLVGRSDPGFPRATLLARRLVSVPIYPSLTEPELAAVVAAVKDIPMPSAVR